MKNGRSSTIRKKETHSGSGKDVVCEVAPGFASSCCVILESISDGVFTVDRNKKITSFNRAAENITGFKIQETLGRYCHDVFRADICLGKCALDETLQSGNQQVHVPARIIDKSGQEKPISISTAVLKNEVGETVGAVETFRDLSEVEELRRRATGAFTFADIVGKHPSMREILSLLPDIAESDSNVLIEGPTGTGKELIARAIHHLSPRRGGPFIAVNCAALPDSLLESELFGYARGAFTGAARNKGGRFLLADKGTLFLDEIAATSAAFQADLLRVIEDGEFMPLGDTRSVKTDFRVITATNEDIKKLSEEERFRKDLFYRLNVAKIKLPPIRDRREDIPFLVDHFIHKFNLLKDRNIRGITPETMSLLTEHPFPGNIRELENIIEYAFITCKEAWIGIQHLPAELMSESDGDRVEPSAFKKEKEFEKIRTIVLNAPGGRDQAAATLGMSRTTLWRKMKKYGLVK